MNCAESGRLTSESRGSRCKPDHSGQNAADPVRCLPLYLRTSATPLVPSTSIQSRSRSKMIRQPGVLSIDVLLDNSNLFPLAGDVQAMDDAGCVAQKRPDDPRSHRAERSLKKDFQSS